MTEYRNLTWSEAKDAITTALDQGSAKANEAWASMSKDQVNEWCDRCREIGPEATIKEMDDYYA